MPADKGMADGHGHRCPLPCILLPPAPQDHPFGFVAKPETKADDSTNLFRWKCLIPGKEGTLWEGGLFPLTLDFTTGATREKGAGAASAGAPASRPRCWDDNPAS